MSYSTYVPSEEERAIIDRAYAAQRKIGAVKTRFVIPPDPVVTDTTQDEPPTLQTELPTGQIDIGGKHITGAHGPSPLDGNWDVITYGDDEWLVKDGVVLKREQ